MTPSSRLESALTPFEVLRVTVNAGVPVPKRVARPSGEITSKGTLLAEKRCQNFAGADVSRVVSRGTVPSTKSRSWSRAISVMFWVPSVAVTSSVTAARARHEPQSSAAQTRVPRGLLSLKHGMRWRGDLSLPSTAIEVVAPKATRNTCVCGGRLCPIRIAAW